MTRAGVSFGVSRPFSREEEQVTDEERPVEVPAYYRKLGGSRDTFYRFDGSSEAWLWKDLHEKRDEACIEAAAAIIEAYTEIGSYPATGEDFHYLAVFMGSLRWLTWGGEEELEEFLAANRPEIERRVREIHAQRMADGEDRTAHQ
jgi:hypothetical protein